MRKLESAEHVDPSMMVEIASVVRRLPKYARLTWSLLKDPTLSGKHRAALTAAVGYSVSPIDAIPGFIPVIGQLDDIGVVLFSLRWVLQSMPDDRAEGYLSRAGLTAQILDDDLALVKRSGVKILKRLIAIAGVTAIALWGVGKLAAKGVFGRIKNAR